jgi:hypothetical protein
MGKRGCVEARGTCPQTEPKLRQGKARAQKNILHLAVFQGWQLLEDLLNGVQMPLEGGDGEGVASNGYPKELESMGGSPGDLAEFVLKKLLGVVPLQMDDLVTERWSPRGGPSILRMVRAASKSSCCPTGSRHPETSSWPGGWGVPVQEGEGLAGGQGQTKVGPEGLLVVAQHN